MTTEPPTKEQPIVPAKVPAKPAAKTGDAGKKDKKAKKGKGGKGEKAAADPDKPSVAAHPRAARAVARAKGWGGLIGFLLGGLPRAAHEHVRRGRPARARGRPRLLRRGVGRCRVPVAQTGDPRGQEPRAEDARTIRAGWPAAGSGEAAGREGKRKVARGGPDHADQPRPPSGGAGAATGQAARAGSPGSATARQRNARGRGSVVGASRSPSSSRPSRAMIPRTSARTSTFACERPRGAGIARTVTNPAPVTAAPSSFPAR